MMNSKLGGVFGGDDDIPGGDSLFYERPTQPSKGSVSGKKGKKGAKGGGAEAKPAEGAAPAAAAAPGANNMAFVCPSLYCYKLNAGTRAFEPQNEGKPLGCVFMGSGTGYVALVYNAQKVPFIQTPINGSLTVKAQANNYVNLDDDKQQNWSLRFNSEQESVNFNLNMFLIKAHHIVHTGEFEDVGMGTWQDLTPGQDDPAFPRGLGSGDTATLRFMAWVFTTNAAAHPQEMLNGAVVVQSNQQQLVLGQGEAQGPIGGLEQGTLGMKRGASRILLVPPSIAQQGHQVGSLAQKVEWLVVRVEVTGMYMKVEGRGGAPLPPSLSFAPLGF